MRKNILVTGGFGFLGGHLIELLVKDKNNSVHVVDNLSSNPIPYEELIKEIGNPTNLTYDICSTADYCLKGKIEKLDAIYHLASVVGPAGILKHAGEIVKSIVNDTYSLIDLALSQKAKLIDVSTSEVYGGGNEGYCLETDARIVSAKTTVRLEYAVGKIATETAIINKTKVTDLDACIVRPFNIAGPRQSGQGGFVLPRFIAMSILNKPLTVFGVGHQIRAFTHVKDMAVGIIKAMEGGKRGEVYNLGNPENKISILEFAKKVIEITKSKSKIIFVDPKTIYGPLYEEGNDKFPDADRAIRELSWHPEHDVDTVISDTFEYMKRCSEEIFDLLAGLNSG